MFSISNELTKKWKLNELNSIINDLDNDLYNTVNSLHLKNENNYENIVVHTAGKSIVILREIIGLCSLGFPDGALSLARNLFEQLIILCFFESIKSSDDFADYIHDYYADIEIKQNKAFIFEYEKINYDEQKLADCKSALESLTNITHSKVKGDYWWSGYSTFSALTDYVISVGAKDKETCTFLRLLHYAYKRACISLHSSSLSNSIRLGNDIDNSLIDTSPKDNGFELPLFFATSCFIMVVGVACNIFKINYDDYIERLNNLAVFYKSYAEREKHNA